MWIPHTWCARRSQEESISGRPVVGELSVFTAGIMIVGEGYRKTLVGIIVGEALVFQSTIVAIADGIIELELQREVESGRCVTGSHNPVLDICLIIPELTHRELRHGIIVILLDIAGAITLYHIVTEAHIAQLVQQEVEIRLHVVAGRIIGVVEVAIASKVIAGVICAISLIGFGTILFLIIVAVICLTYLAIVLIIPNDGIHLVGNLTCDCLLCEV